VIEECWYKNFNVIAAMTSIEMNRKELMTLGRTKLSQ